MQRGVVVIIDWSLYQNELKTFALADGALLRTTPLGRNATRHNMCLCPGEQSVLLTRNSYLEQLWILGDVRRHIRRVPLICTNPQAVCCDANVIVVLTTAALSEMRFITSYSWHDGHVLCHVDVSPGPSSLCLLRNTNRVVFPDIYAKLHVHNASTGQAVRSMGLPLHMPLAGENMYFCRLSELERQGLSRPGCLFYYRHIYICELNGHIESSRDIDTRYFCNVVPLCDGGLLSRNGDGKSMWLFPGLDLRRAWLAFLCLFPSK